MHFILGRRCGKRRTRILHRHPASLKKVSEPQRMSTIAKLRSSEFAVLIPTHPGSENQHIQHGHLLIMRPEKQTPLALNFTSLQSGDLS